MATNVKRDSLTRSDRNILAGATSSQLFRLLITELNTLEWDEYGQLTHPQRVRKLRWARELAFELQSRGTQLSLL